MEAVKVVIAGGLEQQKKSEDQTTRADVRHDEKKHAGVSRFHLFMLETDEAIRRQRHDFPRDEKKEGVARQKNHRRRQQQQIEERAEHADVFASVKTARVAEGINRNCKAQQ